LKPFTQLILVAADGTWRAVINWLDDEDAGIDPVAIKIPTTTDSKVVQKCRKTAIFQFIHLCGERLGMKRDDIFIVSELFGKDCLAFFKVCSPYRRAYMFELNWSQILTVINRVLDIAQQSHLLPGLPQQLRGKSTKTTSHSSKSGSIIHELVETERKYVHDLGNLFDLQKAVQTAGAMTGDVIHSIFLNVRSILEFHHRFLVRMEEMNSMPETRQRWGALFVEQKDGFLATYLPFLANQTKGSRIAHDYFDKIHSVQHPAGYDYTTLAAFLIKPAQRLMRYPMLLNVSVVSFIH
jgi:cell division control protein 24